MKKPIMCNHCEVEMEDGLLVNDGGFWRPSNSVPGFLRPSGDIFGSIKVIASKCPKCGRIELHTE